MDRIALPLVWAGTLGLALAYGVALRPGDALSWAAFALAWGTGALLAGLLTLGATRRDGVPWPAAVLFLATGLWVAGGLTLLLARPGLDPADAPLVWGLPRRAAFLLLGIGLAPGLVVPLAYGLLFDRHTLTADDLEELKRVAAEVGDETGTDGNGASPGRRPSAEGAAAPGDAGAEVRHGRGT